ncbi:hypothetical protein E2C01_094031 [Portunus trituberculatus]|uniref:Uncharacterized protein n=1 Tax=Portunus trituberculatus TaxID=210409 RepID=A0A5B7JW49_PORTR|nr:hypothetical protein [Portunus trituberculatus]
MFQFSSSAVESQTEKEDQGGSEEPSVIQTEDPDDPPPINTGEGERHTQEKAQVTLPSVSSHQQSHALVEESATPPSIRSNDLSVQSTFATVPDDLSIGTAATVQEESPEIQWHKISIDSTQFHKDVKTLITKHNKSKDPKKYVVFWKEIRAELIKITPIYEHFTHMQIRDRYKYINRSLKDMKK